jgi:coenzyme PQQ synthesis protein D (PqqD)
LLRTGISWHSARRSSAPFEKKARSDSASRGGLIGWVEMSSRSITLNEGSVLRAAPEQVSCDIGSQMAILNLKSGIYYGLDSVGSRIWELVQSPRPLGEIEGALLAEYEVEPNRLCPEVRELCQSLARAGLLEICDEARD